MSAYIDDMHPIVMCPIGLASRIRPAGTTPTLLAPSHIAPCAEHETYELRRRCRKELPRGIEGSARDLLLTPPRSTLMPGLCGTLPASLGPLSSEDTKYKLLRIGAGMSCDSDRGGVYLWTDLGTRAYLQIYQIGLNRRPASTGESSFSVTPPSEPRQY